MSQRIEARFRELRQAGRRALIPFITAGDPHPDWTPDIMRSLVAAGADLLELGVPFSDPMADGPVIQAASTRAIAHGVSLAKVLALAAEFRAGDTRTPLVLMGYMNPVERYGYQEFARDAGAAGIDGVLMVDCPPEEMSALDDALAGHGVCSIRLLAPTTTPARMAAITARASGYLYYVSFKGITGADRLDQAAIAAPLAEVRRHTSLPIAVGFGIKDAASAAAVARIADGVVIGSALVQALSGAASAEQAARVAAEFLAPVRRAIDNASGSR